MALMERVALMELPQAVLAARAERRPPTLAVAGAAPAAGCLAGRDQGERRVSLPPSGKQSAAAAFDWRPSLATHGDLPGEAVRSPFELAPGEEASPSRYPQLETDARCSFLRGAAKWAASAPRGESRQSRRIRGSSRVPAKNAG